MKNLEMIKGTFKFIYKEHYNTNYNQIFRTVTIKKIRKNGVYVTIRKLNITNEKEFENFVDDYMGGIKNVR